MSIDLYLEAFEKMPEEDEKLFYRLWSYNRVNTGNETDIDRYHEKLIDLFNEILERKKKEGLYSDCRYQYECVICLSFEDAVKVSDIIFEELKKEYPNIDDHELLLAVAYGVGEFVHFIEKCKKNDELRKELFDNYWITLYLC